jgi:spermidine synthase
LKAVQDARATHPPLLLAAAAISGFAIISFATAWTRILPPVFGTPLLKDTGVVLVMTASLLLGIIYAGRKGEHLGEHWRVFGCLLVGAAAAAFVAFLLLARSERLYAAVSAGFHGAVVSSLGGLFLVLAVLLAPSFLLGAALCLGSRLHGSRLNDGEAGSIFVTMIAMGMSAGALISGFILMPRLGASITLAVVALAVAAVGAASAFKRDPGTGGPSDTGPSVAGQAQPAGPIGGRPVISVAAYFIYIFSSVACAIIWMRFLSQVVGNTVYLSAAMLTVYSAAVTLGSLASARLARRAGGQSFWLGLGAALTGIAWLVPFIFVNRLPFIFLRFFSLAPRLSAPEWREVVLSYFALCFVIMFVPGLLTGTTLPFALRSINPGRRLRIGAFALTTGVILLGILTAILVSLAVPRAGLTTRKVLTALPWLGILAGCVYFVDSRKPFINRLVLGAVMVAAPLALSFFSPPWNKGIATGGLYTSPQRFLYLSNLRNALEATDVAFYEEDRDQAISVLRSPDGVFLRANGKSVQSTAEDLTTQMLSAHIPLLLKDSPRRVLVVGLGTGITLASALAHQVSDVDCVEPVAARVRASRYFAPYSHGALQDSRVNLMSCDPLNYMLLGRQPYDVIICQEPAQGPDFARLARSQLVSGGVAAQVVSFEHVSEGGFGGIVKEFSYYFPYVDLWWGGGTQLILVASLQPMRMPLAALDERTSRGEVRQDLRQLGITRGIGLLSCYMMGRESLLGLAGGAPMNTRARSPLLYNTRPRSGAPDYVQTLIDIDAASEKDVTRFTNRDGEPVEHALVAEALDEGMTARSCYFRSLGAAGERKFRDAQKYLDTARSTCRDNGIFQLRLSDFYVSLSRTQAESNQFQDAINAARRAIEENPVSSRAFYNLANLEAERDPATAATLLRKAIELDPDYLPAYLLKTEAEITLGDIDVASETVAQVLAIEPLNARARHLRALCFIERDLLEEARGDLEFVVKAQPDNSDAVAAMAYTWLVAGNLGKAEGLYRRVLRIDPGNLEALNNLATILAGKGNYYKAIRMWEKALELDPGNADLKKNIESARDRERNQTSGS